MGCKLCKRKDNQSKNTLPSFDDLLQCTARVQIKALYAFEGLNDGDLRFKKGDRLEIKGSDESLLDSDNWITAMDLTTRETGFIPSNYVCLDDGRIENEEWWFDVCRAEAEGLMYRPGLKIGTYMVRNSSAGDAEYVLSVLSVGGNEEPVVKHYRIKRLDNGGYYIRSSDNFKTISDLIASYSNMAKGSCCVLTTPCPKSGPASAQFRDLEVPESEIVLGEEIGSGYFGKVFKGKLRKKIEVAVKLLKENENMTATEFLQEARVMHDLRHKRLVSLIAVCVEADRIMILTEFMPNGSLLSYLRSGVGKKSRFEVLINMASQIAEGMAYLEEKKFIHRDLRADNVLVGQYSEVKVADFGLARVLEDDEIFLASDQEKFPVHWTAPEAGTCKEFSTKSDVWSFGCVLYEIITYGRRLYIGIQKRELFDKLKNGYRMPKPSDIYCPEEYYDIVQKCWKFDPQDRPTFEYLHHFLYDFSTETEKQYARDTWN